MNMTNLFSILLAFCLVLAGCAPVQPGSPEVATTGEPVAVQPSQTPVSPSATLLQASATATRTPRPTATQVPTSTLTPTPNPTATPDPAVFDPSTFGDIHDLDSFVVTYVWKDTEPDYLYDSETRYEYNSNPAGFHVSSKFQHPTNSSDDIYWLGEWSYSKDNLSGLWSVSRATKENFNEFPLDSFDLRKTISISNFNSATYLGIEQYQGIPAYHYTFDETNMIKIENWNVEKVSGELFVSVEGRYPLHSYARFSVKYIPMPGEITSRAGGVYERTQDLVSFNQPVQISLPEDYPNFDLNLDFPLPDGSELRSVYQDARGEISYAYVTPVNEEEFRSFYSSFVSANGWSASTPVAISGPAVWCDPCLTFSKGEQQLVLTFLDEIVSFVHKDYVIGLHFIAPR